MLARKWICVPTAEKTVQRPQGKATALENPRKSLEAAGDSPLARKAEAVSLLRTPHPQDQVYCVIPKTGTKSSNRSWHGSSAHPTTITKTELGVTRQRKNAATPGKRSRLSEPLASLLLAQRRNESLFRWRKQIPFVGDGW